MTKIVSPLRQRGGEQSALARIDVTAIEFLLEGQATNLQAARAEVILTDLRLRRDEMTTLLSDLRSRELTGVAQIDTANANLITAINQGVVQIDLFIAQARTLLEQGSPSGRHQPDASKESLKDF